MKRSRLPILALRHFWRTNLAVALGMAVGAAALAGAFIVGDSVRGSLRRMTLERLGAIDEALVANSFFSSSAASRLAADPAFSAKFDAAEPAILITGSAEHADSRALARGVSILGVGVNFWSLDAFGGGAASPAISAAARERSVAINEALARELGAREGQDILLRVEKPDPIPSEAVHARKSGNIVTMRLTVDRVVPDRGLGRFSLVPAQQLPMNAFIPVAALERFLGKPGEANALFVSNRERPDRPSEDRSAELGSILARHLELADLGLRLRRNAAPEYLSLESARMVLRESDQLAAEAAAKSLGAASAPALAYLANTIGVGDREIPYSVVAALDPPASAPFGGLKLASGEPAPALGPRDILLNSWAAEDLGARVGDRVRLVYYTTGPLGQFETNEAEDFVLRGVVALEGAGADPGLTPEYPGLSDAESIRDWDPPFKVDLTRVRDKDEAYWKERKGTPKAFVSLETGLQLWTSRFGRVTSVRVAPPAGESLDSFEPKLREKLRASVSPESAGLAFQPVKLSGLAASRGASDFTGLFVGFSFFIILSAMLLVRLLFSLGVERRAREIGLLLAVGYEPRAVKRLFLAEGFFLAVIGAAGGALLGIGYAWLMLLGLRTWWVGAVGTTFLHLYVRPASLGLGLAVGMITGLASVWFSVRALASVSAGRLLAGGSAFAGSVSGAGAEARARRRELMIGHVLLALALAAIAGSSLVASSSRAGLFYGGGAALLAALLFYFSAALRASGRGMGAFGRRFPLVALGARNAARHHARSVLTAGLVASAAFIIIAVAANRHPPGHGRIEKNSGNGGFALMAESDVPLAVDLNSAETREDLGLDAAGAPAMANAKVWPLRLNPGEDASCLNLYRPQRPRVLGAPAEFIARGGFKFQSSLAESDAEKANPWLLLDRPAEDGAVPAIGDFNTVMWILHSGLGKTLEIEDASGARIPLRLVGLLKKSALQGELIVAESQFLRLFPERSGFSFFFVESPEAAAPAAREALESALHDQGFDAYPTQERIDAFAAVENTYLSTFQALGGLGLLLGTLGLAAVMLRNVLERRGELALLRSVGYGPRALAALVLAENALLVLVGLGAGGFAALVAVAPTALESGGAFPWASLAGTFLAVAAAGMLAGAAAVASAIRAPLVESLRAP